MRWINNGKVPKWHWLKSGMNGPLEFWVKFSMNFIWCSGIFTGEVYGNGTDRRMASVWAGLQG